MRRFPLSRRLGKILIIIFTATIFAGMVIIPLEIMDPQSNIQSASDGLWWAMSKVTAVGYGDVVPVTNAGRFLGALLQLSGAVMFGALVGTITVYLNQMQEDYEWRRMHEKLDRIEDELRSLKNKTDYIVKNKDSKSSLPPQRWRL